MKVRHGKLLTNEREQLVLDYFRRRRFKLLWGNPKDPRRVAYDEWINGFERFMCRGLDKRTVDWTNGQMNRRWWRWRHDHIWRMRHRRSMSQTWRMPADQTQALDRWIDAFCATQPDTARNAATAGKRGVDPSPAKASPGRDTGRDAGGLDQVVGVATGMGKCHLSLPRR